MINLKASLQKSIEQKIRTLACLESYNDCIGKDSTEIHNQRIVLLNMLRMFDGTLTAADVDTLDCYYTEHFGTKGCLVTDSVSTTGGTTPSIDVIETTTTGQQIKLALNCGNLENSFFKSGRDHSYNEIMDNPFLSNVRSLGLYAIEDSGTPPNHYLVRYAGDTIDSALPTPDGGFNCSECCNDSTNCCLSYPVSFASHAIKFCNEIGAKVIMNCNLNSFDLSAYNSAIAYADAQCGVAGVILAQEYAETYCNCGICGEGNAATIASTATTLANAIIASLPAGAFVTMDWKGLKNNAAITSAYTTSMMTTAHTTDFRFYADEHNLIPTADLVTGRTAQQYYTSINTAIDDRLVAVVSGIKLASGKPTANTQYFSEDNTPFAGTWLQNYFFARLRVKTILIEALTPDSIHYSTLARFDSINAKGAMMNDRGKMMVDIAPIFTSGNTVYQMTLPTAMYGVVSANSSGHGTAVIINSSGISFAKTAIDINGTNQLITSIKSYYSTALMGMTTIGTTFDVPGYSISIIKF